MQFKTTLLALSLLCAVSGYSQQPAQYSLNMMNQLNWNPAYAGLEHSLSVTGGIREQWLGIEGQPSSQFVSAHMPLYIASGGIGIHLENDELGARGITTGMLSYNYQIFSDAGILSFGVSGGIVQYSLDGTVLRTPDGNYQEGVGGPLINHEDDVLPLGMVNNSTTTFGAGVYFQSERLELGLGVRHLTEPSLDLESIPVQLKRALFLNAGYTMEVSSALQLQPSLFVQSDLVETQVNISLLAQYNDNIIAGGAFRGYNQNTIDAAIAIIGFRLSENMRLVYAYDIPLSDIGTISSGSHEIMINYNLNKRIGAGRPPRVIYNPRSL